MNGEPTPTWRQLCRAVGLRIDGDAIEVRFADERGQRIYVEERAGGALRLWSIVARPAALRSMADPRRAAWRRNRLSELVGFDLDRRGRMIGETWLPPGGCSTEEWREYVLTLARACDRVEYLITGRDEA